MVIKQSNVESRTQFAASSVSARWISAMFKMTEAHGTADRTRTLALKEKSRGRNTTHR